MAVSPFSGRRTRNDKIDTSIDYRGFDRDALQVGAASSRIFIISDGMSEATGPS